MQQNNLNPYDSTLATLSVSCSKALQLDLAEALLNQIAVCLYLHPYNALLAACDAMVSSNMKLQNTIVLITILLLAMLKLVCLKPQLYSLVRPLVKNS